LSDDERHPGPLRRAYSGAPWESKVGYCRAVRGGPHVWITGCAPVDADGAVAAPGDPEAQALRCFAIIEKALRDVGARMSDVVRTRMYVTDIGLWEAFGRAHHAMFADHPPTTTMVEVSGLIHPDMLIEIEAEAFVTESRSRLRAAAARALRRRGDPAP